MRILLTGADGFTGQHFARLAVCAGHLIFESKANLLDPLALAAEAEKAQADWVVHLAAIAFVGHEDDHAFYTVNLFGTLHLLDALNRASKKPAKVLIASSANVYGNCPTSPIDEKQAPAPVNHYATSKLAMEHMARTYQDKLALVFARPFNYTGPGQSHSFVIPKLVEHFVKERPVVELGNLNVEREFNDVRFVCESYLRLLEHGKPSEIYNVCAGITYTLKDVLETLTKVTGHTIEVQVNPAFIRANEIKRLCGNPDKLFSLQEKPKFHTLESTLSWMLSSMSTQAE